MTSDRWLRRPRLRARWLSLLGNPAARNSLFMMGGRVGMALLQALQFLLLARPLGAHEFGRVASVTVIASVMLPFSSLGLGNVAIARIARGESSPERCLGNALLVTTGSGAIAVAAAVGIAAVFLNDSQAWQLALLLGISEILLTKYIDVAAHVYMGLERHQFSAAFYNLQLLLRVALALALPWLFAQPTAMDWAVLHIGSGALAACLVLLVSAHHLGRPTIAPQEAIRDAKTGVFFSITLAARSVRVDSDKAFLAREVSAELAGAYTGAFRLVGFASIPVFEIQNALLARTFRDGQGGLKGILAGQRRVLSAAVAYGVLLAPALYLAAPLVPWLLGPTYVISSEILRGLCALPLLFIVQSLCTQALSATEMLRPVSVVHAIAAAVTVTLNALLVPSYGWQGAAAAAYVSQLCLLGCLVLLTTRRLRREVQPSS